MRRSRRRLFLITTGAFLAAPHLARAQAAKKPVLGILNPQPMPPPAALTQSPLRVRLRELGWVEGSTLDFENAFGGGREDRLAELAAGLVAKNVDVIWTVGPEAAVAAARATRSIPIVFWGVPYPVEQGLINSFARPGKNVTGVAWHASPEVGAKRLELLREIAPATRRVAHLAVPTASYRVAGGPAQVTPAIGSTAEKMGFEFREFPVEKAADFDDAFAAIRAWGAQAITVSGTALTIRERRRITDFAIQHRLPSAFTLPVFVESGGLVSYAIDWRPTMALAANYVDRILRGANPGDLPVDLPSKYETTVNLMTAKALGVTIPQSILIRADRVFASPSDIVREPIQPGRP